LVEFTDVYPTLIDLCSLNKNKDLEGKSFASFFQKKQERFREMAYSIYPKGGRIGRSIRTDHYRYTEWAAKDGTKEIELYDHEKDPQENENVAQMSEYQQEIIKLSKQLKNVRL
jgi:iduronate 2-sulfatase